MTLSRTQRHELEILGWATSRHKARRPRLVSPTDILCVGRDIDFDEQDPDWWLAGLERHR